MKGYLLLSEARSGSSWLGSIVSGTGCMGNASEALHPNFFGRNPGRHHSAESFFHAVIESTSTPNGRFGIKIFPKHLNWVESQFGFDFIARCQSEHDVKIVVLQRQNRLEQAISLHRARVTSQWKSSRPQKYPPRYDFTGICRAYYQIAESETFWRSYCELRQLAVEHFFYENLAADPSPYLQTLAAHLEVELPNQLSAGLRVQRDKTTDEWMTQFKKEALSEKVLTGNHLSKPPARTIGNIVRLLRKRSLAA